MEWLQCQYTVGEITTTFVLTAVQKWEVIEMVLTCQDCKHCKRCWESDRSYICTSFQKAEVTGKMLKVQKIKAKMYTEEEK